MAEKKFNPADHLIKLKGKDYLQVCWRLVWFREEHPEWGIETELVEHKNGEYAVFKATILDPNNPITDCVLSTGYGSESKTDFSDYLEKAETKAVGRALAMLGYGTQFAPDLDEGERIVDSPIDRNNKPETPEAPVPIICENCGRPITAVKKPTGEIVPVDTIIKGSSEKYGKRLCYKCCAKEKAK